MMTFRFLDAILRRDGRAVRKASAADLVRVRACFDPDFYCAQTGLDLPAEEAFGHFVREGWRDGHDPSAAFSVADYLALNPDVAAAGMNPLVHFVEFGKAEGRTTTPSARTVHTPAPRTRPEDTADRIRAEAREIARDIDRRFYSALSGLCFASAEDAALHYLQHGWRLDLDPNPDFSTTAYLRHYPDVAQAGIPPLLHYVRAGRAEGRIARDRVDEVARVLTATPDLAGMEADWQRGREVPEPLSTVDAVARILSAMGDTADRLVLAFTHDDFRAIRGGVQLCVGTEAAIAAARGVGYIALYPAEPRPRFAPDPEATLLYAIVGGDRIGPFTVDSLLPVVARLARKRRVDLVIHVLLGHAPEHVARIAKAAKVTRAFAWLHDATFLCPSYALQRNLVAQCGAPAPDSSACRLCLFGEERGDHLARLHAMMQAVRIHALAPSKAAADMIARGTALPFDGTTVIPHAVLAEDREKPAAAVRGNAPATVAFIGAPVHHKGYTAFRRLLRRNLGREDLRFLYFGNARHREPGLRSIGVDVTAASPDAMIDALRRESVDFVIHWANWEETFSFSTYEAIRAGADVLTHPGTGNVAALVTETGRGRVLADEAALDAFLAPDTLAAATRARRAKRHPIVSRTSDLSFTALDAMTPARRAPKPKPKPRRGATSTRKRAGVHQ